MKYLVFNTKKVALQRNAQEAQFRGCHGITQYWWIARVTKAGKWALCIPDNDHGSLTPSEVSQLKDSVVWPDNPIPH